MWVRCVRPCWFDSRPRSHCCIMKCGFNEYWHSSWFQEFHWNSDMCCTHPGVPVDVHYGSRNSTGILTCVVPILEFRWTSGIHHGSRNSTGILKCVLPMLEFWWMSGIHPGSRNSTGIPKCVLPMPEFRWTSSIHHPQFQEFRWNSILCYTHV